MRILMVNKFLYPRGGAESYMLKLGQQLENSGHTVEYFGMYDEKNTVGNSAGLYTQNMDFHSGKLSRFLYPFKIIYSAEAYKKISRVIDCFKPDVVHMKHSPCTDGTRLSDDMPEPPFVQLQTKPPLHYLRRQKQVRLS